MSEDRDLVRRLIETGDWAIYVAEWAKADENTIAGMMWAAWWLDMEIQNGGLNQFFYNQCFAGGRVTALDAEIEALRMARLPDHAALVEEAWRRWSERRSELEASWADESIVSFSESYQLAVFDDLDEAYMAIDVERSEHDAHPVALDRCLVNHLDRVADAFEGPFVTPISSSRSTPKSPPRRAR
jgi:hypothetical protein